MLLTSHLGDPGRKPLTVAQFRTLAQRVSAAMPQTQARDLEPGDLIALGYGRETADRIVSLLESTDQLSWYVSKGAKHDCVPVTRVSQGYPVNVRKRLGLDSPGCLWAKGDLSLLEKPAVSLVGSRELGILNEAFAREAGRQAALQGYVLVSGNARGADSLAQEAVLENGGQVISIVADVLSEHKKAENVLYLSEEGYDLTFSPQRALSRNRVIHSWGRLTLVAQCRKGVGGTWDGTVKNLKYNWTPVCCLDDGSPGSEELAQMGARLISGTQLQDLTDLGMEDKSLFD